MDDERHWYRYHQLFAEFLRSRLKAERDRGTLGEPVEALHRRASIWYERNHFMDRAIDHALAANDFEHAAWLIEAFRASASEGGELVILLRWFAALPDTIIRKRPRLSLGSAYWLEGDLSSASAILIEAREVCQNTGNFYTFYITTAYLGQVRLAQGRLREAIRLYRQALQVLAERGREGTEGNGVYVGLGALLYERNKLDEAERLVQQGIDLGQQENNMLVFIAGKSTLARLRQAQGKEQEAGDLMQQVITLAKPHHIIWTWIPGPIETAQVRFWLAQGNVAEAAEWAHERRRNAPEYGNKQSHPPYFQEIEEILLARLSLAQHRHTEALEALDRLQTEAQAAGRMEHVLEILILEALTYQDQGNLDGALATLASALELAEPEGYIRTFVDEGPAMAALLRRRRATQGRETDYVERLLEAFGHDEATIEPTSSHDRQHCTTAYAATAGRTTQ